MLFIRLKNYICDFLANRLCSSFIVGMNPIGKKNNIDFGHRVADYSGSRITGVAKRLLGRIGTFWLGITGMDIKAESAAMRLSGGQHSDGFGTENLYAVIGAII